MGNDITILIPTKFKKDEKGKVINLLKKKFEIREIEDQLDYKLPVIWIYLHNGKYSFLTSIILLKALDPFEDFRKTETLFFKMSWWHTEYSKYDEVMDFAIDLCAILGANTFYGSDEGADEVLFIGSKEGKEEYLEAIEKHLKYLKDYRDATKEEIGQLVKKTAIFEKRKNGFVLIKFREDPWDSQTPLKFYKALKKEENKT